MRPRTVIALATITTVAVITCAILPNPGGALLEIESQHEQQELSPSATIRGTVYVVLSPECPVSNSYLPKLRQLHAEFRHSGIEFVGVLPKAVAVGTDVESFVKSFEIPFPIIIDSSNRLCADLAVTHTPQAVLVSGDGTSVYSGRIDDAFVRIAGQRREPRDHSLKNAITDYLAGRTLKRGTTTPIGCRIEFGQPKSSKSTDVTFTQQVAPIIFERCSRCHRPGESAPFSLLTFEDAVRHAKQILEVVERRLMPPWKARPNFGSFRNEHRLSEEEIKTIRHWVLNGTVEGPPGELPATPVFEDGWQLGTPDLELVMPEAFNVPAEGSDVYQHFVIPTGLTNDRLVRAFEFRPGAPEVVHHAFAYFDTTGQGRELDAREPGPGYNRVGSPGFVVSGSLGGWGPGGLPRTLPLGMGRPLPKNADLLFQIHYHPTGRAVQDRSRIGIYFAEDFAQRLVTEIMVCDTDLTIPANESGHHHRAEWKLPVDTILIDVTPHMHVLGKSIQATAHLPDGSVSPLIQIDDWDFYWQDSYVFAEPVELPAGSRIVVNCLFDNSSDNPLNPADPPRTVHWGDFSDDEMGICYFQATTNSHSDYVKLNNAASAFFQFQWDQFQQRKTSGTWPSSSAGNSSRENE